MTNAGCIEELFRDVVVALQRANHRFCVSHGYKGYPKHIGSDVDVISENPAQVPRILSERMVATVVRVLEGDKAAAYILYRQCSGTPVFLILDVSAGCRHEGYVYFEGDEILKTSRSFKFFEVPSPELEFTCYLITKLMKGSLDESQGRRLSELYGENPTACNLQLARFFPGAESNLVAAAARSGEWEPVRRQIEHLRRATLDKAGHEQPLGTLRHRLGKARGKLGSILRPAGLMVAFLGPDGSGKSTVMSRVERDLAPAFLGSTKLYHKRPLASAFRWTKRHRTQPRPGVPAPGDGATPHAQHARPPRGLVVSLAKLGFWWIDYTVLGYLGDVLPRLMRSTLLMFDRYYDDLLVYPKNYRYGGPLWLARFVGRFVPRPHLVILLDAPPEVIQARKREVPFEETARQRETYLKTVGGLSNGHVIDASKPLDEVVAEAERIILGYMADRTARRLKL